MTQQLNIRNNIQQIQRAETYQSFNNSYILTQNSINQQRKKSENDRQNRNAEIKEILSRRQEMSPLIIDKKSFSKRILRINDSKKNFLSKSFELHILIPQNHSLLRRKSGVEQLSSKQIRFNCLYPMTSIAQEELKVAILQAEQRTKERRKTLFQRMSGILKKHQTVIQCFNKNEKLPQKEIQKSKIGLMHQEAMQVIETITTLQQSNQQQENFQLEKNQQEQQGTFRKLSRKLKKIDKTQPKVILSLTQQTKKPFQTITNYINEKTTSLKDLSLGKIPISTLQKSNFIPNQSFVEFQDMVSSPKQSQKKQNLIQSCLNLPDIKFNYSSRINNYNSYLIKRGNRSYQHLFSYSQKPNDSKR